jgi:hypothetical protein
MSYPPPYDPQQPPPPGPPGFGPPPTGNPMTGHPGMGQPPPPKKGNKKLIFAIVGGLLGLCCVGGAIAAVTNGDDDPDAAGTASAAATAPAKKPAKATPKATKAQPEVEPQEAVPTEEVAAGPGFGDKVRDGKFEFTVTKMDCSKTRVGSQYLDKTAQGKFCQISLTVKNIGDEAQTFSGSSQKAMDADGVEYSNDGAAELYANKDGSTFLNEVNPGNQTKGVLIFDVPKATKLTSLELHDSPFSGGVEVSLS